MGNAISSQSDDPAELTKMATSCRDKFQASGAWKDISNAVQCIEKAISLTPNDAPQMISRLTILSVLLWARFNLQRNAEDLDRSIQLWGAIISFSSKGDQALPARLASLSFAHNSRFKHLNKLEDLEKSIEYMSRAISFIPQAHADLPSRLHYLGSLFICRFSHQRELEDRDKAVEYWSQAAALAPPGHPEISDWRSELAPLLDQPFNNPSERANLNESIERMTQAVSAAPEGHPEIIFWLCSLGYYLGVRFQHLGDFKDLEESIEYMTQVVSISPKDHPSLHNFLSNLGSALLSRFEHLGQPKDLHKAIEYQQRAVLLIGQSHSDMLKQVCNLGELLRTRYQRFGEISDLDEAILRMSEVASRTSQTCKDRPYLLNNLGISYCYRSRELGDPEDIQKAVDYIAQSVSLMREGDTFLPSRLNNLSYSLECRFNHFHKIQDLNASIDRILQAITLTSSDHLEAPTLFNNAGYRFCLRFKALGDIADLHRAVDHMSQAVELTPEIHADRPRWLNGLCFALQNRFKQLGDRKDLKAAIEHMGQGISHTPQGHPELPWMLHNLGYLYRERSSLPGYSGKAEDVLQAIKHFRQATESSTGSLSLKAAAALEWARTCSHHNIASPLPAYGQFMELLTQLVWLGSSVRNRYDQIKEVGDATSKAAAAAIEVGEHALALEWLEEGRSIVWKQMLQLRTPTEDLFEVAPALAIELNQVAHDLDSASSPTTTKEITLSNSLSMEQAVHRQHRLADRWKQLIEEARHRPGFESFMRPRKVSELLHCAQSGPVVVINAHKTRCDALVIKQGCADRKDITHIPLEFKYAEAVNARAQVEYLANTRGFTTRGPVFEENDNEGCFGNMLAVLWAKVVQPVLGVLGYTHPPSTADLPHITWCTTGPFSFLPLHAAGDYSTGSWVFNYVVSSYTPTLSALLPSLPSTAFAGILAVGQESTSGMPRLPGTTPELNHIQEKSRGLPFTRLDGSNATPSAVMTGIEEHSWVHLACHASQNPANPLQSAFYLHDGTLDLATIARKQLKNADLAFLSACETATGDDRLSDEAVHLAAGMLMAGYKSVIATMWSINDAEAPLVTEKVYEYLLEGGTPDARRAAVAVHKATEQLRTKVGVEAFKTWVPYIHIGR